MVQTQAVANNHTTSPIEEQMIPLLHSRVVSLHERVKS